jgi:tRNA-specific 2-thiouridylase
MQDKQKSVLVGMSGGVDSSLSAALLRAQGYRVVGGFIKNWSDAKDGWTGECAWRAERRDAMRVAARLKIPLLTFDFEELYRRYVVDEMFRRYAAGATPNPDVLCNEMIKFGVFFAEARRLGFGYIATGHYARVDQDAQGTAHLFRGVDPDKDQSYFLYRISQEALRSTLFPIGHLKKNEVREQAMSLHLPVASKPDSQGICFIGKLEMSSFLRSRIPASPGDILDSDGHIVGRHQGLDQYTIGQRHGMAIGAGNAWYVAKKDASRNALIVVPRDDHPLLYSNEAYLEDVRWIAGNPPSLPLQCDIQVRYRQPPMPARIFSVTNSDALQVVFSESVKAVAVGQSAVFYQGDECIGGGILQMAVVE